MPAQVQGLQTRACPVCDSTQAEIFMRFTPDLISQKNPSYKADVFRRAVLGYEDQLNYSKCLACGMIYCPSVWSDEILRKVYEEAIDHEASGKKTLEIEKRLWLLREWE